MTLMVSLTPRALQRPIIRMLSVATRPGSCRAPYSTLHDKGRAQNHQHHSSAFRRQRLEGWCHPSRSLSSSSLKCTRAFSTQQMPYVARELGHSSHPISVTESASLSSASTPKTTYHLALTDEAGARREISNLQAETIAMACGQHEQILSDNTRAGFLIGDGTGVGKGRMIAGIILENFIRGRKKSVWVSASTDLVEDAKRDLSHVLTEGEKGMIKCHQLKEMKVSAVLDMPSGVLFSTYSLLARKNLDRLDQIVNWCGGKSFDGCLVLDEFHRARNINKKNSGEGETGETQSTHAVAELQRRMPLARVVYVSATALNSHQQIQFFPRLGIVGDGMMFSSMDLESLFKDSAFGVKELLTVYLKSRGKAVFRTLSFEGVDFVAAEARLPPGFENKYDSACKIWFDIIKYAEDEAEIIRRGGDSKATSEAANIMRQLWSHHQKFFGQMLLAAKVPTVVELVNDALLQGKCAIITLQSTGEAAATKGPQDDKDDLSSTAEAQVITYIRKLQHMSVEDRLKLEARVKKLSLPGNPLDDIIDKLGGPDRVAEMTGRKLRTIRDPATGMWSQQKRGAGTKAHSSINVKERALFQAGKKVIAIISDASSTGTSLHADEGCDSQGRRRHIIMQLPWSADKTIQQMGRSHRSNQSSAPEYFVVRTPIGAERRYVNIIEDRMKSLGAMTRGDREGIKTGLTEDYLSLDCELSSVANVVTKDIVSELEDDSTGLMWKDLRHVGNSDFTLRVDLKKDMKHARLQSTSVVWKFLNRVAGLPIASQAELLANFDNRVQHIIQAMHADGEYGARIWGADGKAVYILMHSVDVFVCPTTGDKTTLVQLRKDRRISFEAASNLLEERIRLLQQLGEEDDRSGFYFRNKKGANVMLALKVRNAAAHEKKAEEYNIITPSLGWDASSKTEGKKITASQLDFWKETLKFDPKDIIAFQERWKSGYESCEGYGRAKAFKLAHLLTGNVLPFWKQTSHERPMETAHAKLACGKPLFGQILRECEIPNVLNTFQAIAPPGMCNTKAVQDILGRIKLVSKIVSEDQPE